MAVSIVSVLYRSLCLVALLGATTFVTENAEAKGAKPAGGAKPGGIAHAGLPSHVGSKPILKPAAGPIVKSPGFGGSTARTKAPQTLPKQFPANPNLIGGNIKPVKKPLVGTPINPGSFPTFPPINPGTGNPGSGGGGIPTTPPINPNPPVVVHPYPRCHPHYWFGYGYRFGLIGWRGGCYVPPVCTVPVVQTVNVGGSTIVVQDNDTILAGALQIDATAELTRVVVASTVTLSGTNLGADSGQVLLEINGLALPCRMDVWAADKATVTLPSFGLGSETKGKMHIIRADGSVARSLDVMVVPAVEAAKE